jgi:hypothetical protein
MRPKLRPVRRIKALGLRRDSVAEFRHLGIMFWLGPQILGSYASKLLVGRPGLDPGTLGLKGSCDWLLYVGLVARVV